VVALGGEYIYIYTHTYIGFWSETPQHGCLHEDVNTGKDNIKNGSLRKKMGRCQMDTPGSGNRLAIGSCEYGNGPSGCIKCRISDKLRNY